MTIVLWLVLSIVVAVVASKKGRSAGAFLALSVFLSPLVGIIILAVLGDGQKGGNGV